MASHYEVRADGKGIDVVGYKELFAGNVAPSIETREALELEQTEPDAETDGD